MKAAAGEASVLRMQASAGVASRASVASVASVLSPDDGLTKEHVKHVPFHQHVPFQKMQAQGTTNSTTASASHSSNTSDLTSSPGTRHSVYDGFNEIHVKNAEKCKGGLEEVAEVVAPEYIIPGSRQAQQHRLGPAYEIGLCATGVGPPRCTPQMPSYAKELVQGAGAEEVAATHLGGGRGAGARAGGGHALGGNGILSTPVAVEAHARAGGLSFEGAMLKHMDPAMLAARLNAQLGSR